MANWTANAIVVASYLSVVNAVGEQSTFIVYMVCMSQFVVKERIATTRFVNFSFSNISFPLYHLQWLADRSYRSSIVNLRVRA